MQPSKARSAVLKLLGHFKGQTILADTNVGIMSHLTLTQYVKSAVKIWWTWTLESNVQSGTGLRNGTYMLDIRTSLMCIHRWYLWFERLDALTTSDWLFYMCALWWSVIPIWRVWCQLSSIDLTNSIISTIQLFQRFEKLFLNMCSLMIDLLMIKQLDLRRYKRYKRYKVMKI